jgi:2-polyprenyl-3-methyl-5-hydroxy-6-metoxy-1,4-benzoquinol methylase
MAGTSSGGPWQKLDVNVAHSARVYDYWLGGKDNFAADREAGDRVIAIRPAIRSEVRQNRAFLRRAVRYLAADAGVRQFLDIGTGLPSAGNTHEVAQEAAPSARVVYVDNDPLVLAHARALLTGTPGTTAYLDADLREPGKILRDAAASLDFSKPVAVMLVAVLHHVTDADDPAGIVATLMAAVPPGSYLVISHPAADVHSEAVAQVAAEYNEHVATGQTRRTREQVTAFFDGLELLPPGVVQTPQWRPDGPAATDPVPMWAGVGRKAG